MPPNREQLHREVNKEETPPPLPIKVNEDQAPAIRQEGVTYAEFQAAFAMLAQVLANQANREVALPSQGYFIGNKTLRLYEDEPV